MEAAKPPEKQAQDSFAAEVQGTGSEALNNAATWTWNEPFRMAFQVILGDLPFFVPIALICGLIDLVPLGSLLYGPVLCSLAIVIGYEQLMDPQKLKLQGMVERWSHRIWPLSLVFLLVYLIYGGVLLCGALAGGLWAGASVLTLGSEPGSAGAILAMVGVGFMVLVTSIAFVLISLLISFSHEETLLFEASPMEALRRSVRLVWAAGLSLLGFYCLLFGIHISIILGIKILTTLAQGSAYLGLALMGLGQTGPWLAWALANVVGSTVGALFEIGFGLTWTYRFLHDRARVGAN